MFVIQHYLYAKIVNSGYCECQFRWVCFHHTLNNNKLHLPHYHLIYCCNGYGNNAINGIKVTSTWFMMTTFMMLSIIFLYQLFKLCIFIFFINNDVNFIYDNISCSHKWICKSFKMTWPINNKKLINLGGLSLMLLSSYIFLSFSSITISVSSMTISIVFTNAAISYSECFG